MTEGFLTRMAERSRARLEAARAAMRPAELEARALDRGAPRVPSLPHDDFGIIAEIKPSSPSEGVLSSVDDQQVRQRARSYASAGAGAISVLTEPERFGGRLEYLEVCSEAGLPVMRKDFLVDPYQVWEARAYGADGVLLIARMTEPDMLERMLDAAESLGTFALVEAFDEHDLGLCRTAVEGRSRALVGVNCRDLSNLRTDPGSFDRLAPRPSDSVDFVAESGLESAHDVARVARLGFRWALIGTALMRAAQPDDLLQELVRAGRKARLKCISA